MKEGHKNIIGIVEKYKKQAQMYTGMCNRAITVLYEQWMCVGALGPLITISQTETVQSKRSHYRYENAYNLRINIGYVRDPLQTIAALALPTCPSKEGLELLRPTNNGALLHKKSCRI